jgi:hypothetical protein
MMSVKSGLKLIFALFLFIYHFCSPTVLLIVFIRITCAQSPESFIFFIQRFYIVNHSYKCTCNNYLQLNLGFKK